MPANSIERRICFSGILIGAGLIVQMITLAWDHPLAFVAFLVVRCPMVGAGILFYLYSLVSHHSLQNGAAEHPPKFSS